MRKLFFGAALAALATVTSIPAAQAQPYAWGGRNYCWYDGGWHGPGYYWCGYRWRHGYGWGGGWGWHGWGHGYRHGYYRGGYHGGYHGGRHGGWHGGGGHGGYRGGHHGGEYRDDYILHGLSTPKRFGLKGCAKKALARCYAGQGLFAQLTVTSKAQR